MALDLAVEEVVKEMEHDLQGPLVSTSRGLTQEDARQHGELGPIQQGTITKRMRTVHHAIARMEASGMLIVDISRVIGYTTHTISTLQKNPAYRDLVAHYCDKADKESFDLTERLFYTGLDALDALHDRILDPDQPIPIKDLRQIVVDLADRTGHTPIKRTERVNYHIGLTPEELAEAKSASRGEGRGGPAEVTPEPREPLAAPRPPDSPAEESQAGEERPIPLLAAAAGGEARGEALRAEVRDPSAEEASA